MLHSTTTNQKSPSGITNLSVSWACVNTSRQIYELSEKRQLKPPQHVLLQRNIYKEAISQRLPEDVSQL